jgi:hypothetical protein
MPASLRICHTVDGEHGDLGSQEEDLGIPCTASELARVL